MNDTDYLELAVEQAKKSVAIGEFPAGAVIVKDGEVISIGVSIGFSLHDPTSHAEMSAIRDACKRLNTTDLTGAVLYESIECCTMCFSAANWSGVSKIIYAVKKTAQMVTKGYYEGNTDNKTLNEMNSRQIELVYAQDLQPESLRVITEWEIQGGFNKTQSSPVKK
ncbi:MAG: hypothetical protein RLZZ455_558 [Candidatus Parcubacteria bacterium]